MGPQRGSRAPRASLAEVVADAELDISLGDEGYHIACCKTDAFFCAKRFHPELVADRDMSEDDCCQACVDIRYAMMCQAHQHCPLSRMKICPR